MEIVFYHTNPSAEIEKVRDGFFVKDKIRNRLYGIFHSFIEAEKKYNEIVNRR